jgi:polyhydroxyalkanoate synthesis repressor PhaR
VAYHIKRYANRKLYDPQTSRYVTLEDVRELIRIGKEIEVREAASGEDLTSLTLTQILLEIEKSHRESLPAAALHQLIKYGDAWMELFQQSLRTNPLDVMAAGQREAERFFRQWAPPAPPAAKPAASDSPAASGEPNTAPESTKDLRDELAALKQRLREVEERISSSKPRRRRT